MDQTVDLKAKTKQQLLDLTKPFAPDDVRQRPQGGQMLSYITARHVENRLDSVVGPLNWWAKFEVIPGGCICDLTIRFADDTELTKQGAGACDDTPDEGNNFKGQFSDAFKRAAATIGIGRYLYRDGVPTWHCQEPAAPFAGEKKATVPAYTRSQPAASGQSGGAVFSPFQIPTSPKGYFPWILNLEKHYGVKLLDTVVAGFCAGRRYPARTNEWSQGMAAEIIQDLIQHIQGLPNYAGEFGAAEQPPPPAPATHYPPQQPAQPTYSQPQAQSDDIPF